ncbi:MAG: HD domain-containing protein [Candidatus Undinarchaeales archaeon]|jgi:hypothetical protein|nr:HD domain-containing protein [Candidatus Undinarchaeales archaeon]MDP7494119.1 HD domain-containing protein [Candidatus Undinarchaeales archaeon]
MDIAQRASKGIDKELRSSPKAAGLMDLLRKDKETEALLEQANTMMILRYGFTDHGRTHSLIVTHNALRMMRILDKAGVNSETSKLLSLGPDDLRCIVAAGAYLHDVGNAVHRDNHFIHSVMLAKGVLDRLLPQIYSDVTVRTRIMTEILNCIYVHDVYEHPKLESVTLESGIVSVADGTDLAAGRSRIPYKLGKVDIHSVSAMAVRRLRIVEGKEKPLRFEVEMTESAGIFQVQRILGEKIRSSALREHVEVIATTEPSNRPLRTRLEF